MACRFGPGAFEAGASVAFGVCARAALLRGLPTVPPGDVDAEADVERAETEGE